MAKREPGDRDLGLDRPITRRDFVHGTGATLATVALGGVSHAADRASHAASGSRTTGGPYPPLRSGLRGAHPGSFETAHELARAGRRDFGPVREQSDAPYDLVVVGAGISGLAAAWFAREADPDARVLVLDNHDDFGGHAKRNEFRVDGRTVLGHGGSQSLERPSAYSDVARRLLDALAVDLDRFDTAYDHDFYRRNGLGPQVFFDREHHGVDRLVPSPLLRGEFFLPTGPGPSTLAESIAQMPLSEDARAQLLRLVTSRDDQMPEPIWREPGRLEKISYETFLTDVVGITSQEVLDLLRPATSFYMGIGTDAVPALEALAMGLPGLGSTGLGMIEKPARWLATRLVEPYIHHFPDGNASVARLLVRQLVPGAAPGSTMDDIVLAPFDYAQLDREGEPVRIRLASTVVRVRPEGDGVVLHYVRDGAAHRVRAKRCVLACWHAVIPHLCPELPDAQREALASQVKSPLVYSTVVLRQWHAVQRAGLGNAYCPGAWHQIVYPDFPVSLGGYAHGRTPDEPLVLALQRIPGRPGLAPRDQFRAGRYELLATPFEEIERATRRQLTGMLGEHGFDPAEDIAALTVNRWPHGYAYTPNPLFDPECAPGEAPNEIARRRFGPIAIANSDAAAQAYLDAAIDEAWRATQELA